MVGRTFFCKALLVDGRIVSGNHAPHFPKKRRTNSLRYREWKSHRISIYVLGTVQLGQDYGVANTAGKPAQSTAQEILSLSTRIGINCFDTAQHYGNSEAILGSHFAAEGQDPYLVTKIGPAVDMREPGQLEEALRGSFDRLRRNSLWGVMIHKADWLKVWGEISAPLLRWKESGRVAHLGASVYTVEQAEIALANPDIDMIQVPCNAWDQRMRAAGVFAAADRAGKLCFVRSIYLQGLLTMTPEQVAEKLPHAREASARWADVALELRMDPVELASRFALSLGNPLVIGAETPRQILSNYQHLESPPLDADELDFLSREMGAVVSESIANPVLWPKG